MSINLTVPVEPAAPLLKPKLTVIGVGGAGGNAVNNMINAELEGVDFVVANTDAQSLALSKTDHRIQLGTALTQGLGAGSRPEVGRAAAEETIDEILAELEGAHMTFIAAGMGGGTGTGGAPVIARAAKEKGILTVGVVTKPFQFEGAHRMAQAEAGIDELEQYVDTLIVIPNQNLFRIANEKTTFADAFSMADEVLYSGVRGVTDLMVMPGLINLDFADIRTVMGEMGKAMMGTGEAEGERRALDAAEAAIANPLLDDMSMKGANGVLINITGGMDITLFEVDEAANRIRAEVDEDAYIIVGSAFDQNMEGTMRVSVVATGIDASAQQMPLPTMLHLAEELGHTEPERFEPEPEPAQAYVPDFELEPESVSEPEPASEPALASYLPEAPASAGEMPVQADAESVLEIESESESEAEYEAEPEMSPPPAAMPKMGATDAFIPPKPASGEFGGEIMAEADETPMESQEETAGIADIVSKFTSAPVTQSKRVSLFERVTGSGRAAFGKKSRKTEDQQEVSEVTKNKGIPPMQEATEETGNAATETRDALAEHSSNNIQAFGNVTDGTPEEVMEAVDEDNKLGGLDPEDRLSSSEGEEDLLDIPAFLRRQAN